MTLLFVVLVTTTSVTFIRFRRHLSKFRAIVSANVLVTVGLITLSAFEIEGENNTFYTTWSGDSLQSSENVIGINGLFANKLGLVHSQEVTIKKVENVISCNQAFVEPVSVDDWEILELHAEEVESSLLNQVRVVSPGLVFPIWINKSICIFVKIGSLEPSGNCCMLEERTEVHITPKDRKPNMAVPSSSAGVVSAASADQLKTKSKPRKSVSFIDEVQEVKDGTDSQTESSHRDQGLMSSLFNSVKTWWNGEDIEEINNDGKNSKVEKNEFMDSDWCSSLRVQPRGNFKQPTETSDRIPLCISDQPCNVYISRKTFLKHCKVGAGDIMKNCENRTFLAEISRLPSPVEREVLMKKKMERMGSRLAGENADNLLEMAASNDDTDGILRAKSVIRVIVFDENNRHILVNTQQNEISTIHLEDECGVLDNHIMMSDELRRQLGADRTGRVLIKSIRRQAGSQVKTGALNVYPLFPMPEGFTPELLSLALKCWVRLHCDPHMPLIATTAALLNVTLTPDMKKDMLVSFNTEPSQTNASSSDEQQKFITLDPASMEEVVIHVENQLTSENKPGFLTHVPTHTLEGIDTHAIAVELENLGGLGELPSQLTSHICQCLCVSPLTEATYSSTPGLHSGGVMVTGQRGVGKTSLVRGVCKQLVDIPSYVHVAMLDCKQLRGKRVDNIKKTLQRCFTEAAWRQPSIVVLDDLDLICGAPAGPEQEMSGDAMYFAKVAQLICELLKTEMVEKSHICLVVTCKSRAAVHKSLSTSRGLHYFQADIEIQTPDKEQRLQMLTSIVKNNTSISADTVDNLDFTKVVTKTEGYVARDLKTVVQRALHAHTMMNKDNTGDISLTTEDFDVGLHGFTPSCLKNVSLHKPGDLGWEDVGGLHNVRNTLVETLQWPSKYPELFANCPLRLRSGILLYGAPGTGKTLLAGVVAKECGLNFISIKGPELLSKYIGASEQAVRNTFIRAQSARPCILFFDEFDSLAPRRGHDSTGVTDRVVNQLLTQLDGVEGLQGVYVLGATSRPDLIDPALLRPGRLDKALHCDLPSQEERLDILQSLTRNMQLSKDVQLEHLAEICEYFTGADFKALLYNAQLEAIHQVHGHEMQGSIANSGAGKKASENSVLSNGSWETLNLPSKENDVEVVAATGEVLKVRDKTLCQLAYIPTLEKGIKEMTCEEDLQIREKILPLLDDNIKDDDKNEKESTSIVIQAGHFWNAFKTMGPSVTEMERRKYQRIYENFVHSRGGNFNDGMQTVGKRATLA